MSPNAIKETFSNFLVGMKYVGIIAVILAVIVFLFRNWIYQNFLKSVFIFFAVLIFYSLIARLGKEIKSRH